MEQLIRIKHEQGMLEGMLKIPKLAKGLVLFAHGSGSSRLSPRNNFVADVLNKNNLATLLIDLLSKEEDKNQQLKFDIPFLAERLNITLLWLKKEPQTKVLNVGLFGASTGAAAALQIASEMNGEIKAIVSRGGRPDLAINLDRVTAPTLLIVGEEDGDVIKLNELALKKLHCLKKIEIVPHATHLFEEPGCLEEVSNLAKDWFLKYFT